MYGESINSLRLRSVSFLFIELGTIATYSYIQFYGSPMLPNNA